ncbi:di-heme oxidoreductase family protein [Methyloversatilis thermotolerans]|uniref:di-heme oxidoreductase family protein n=1 Tax=Methyloversatilis thermotolerans TaxID=1346290 RepID=UPI0018DEEC52|nr:di-heme oxidoredictase family protein [Methyloversatilis thermotolerans]
MTHRFALRGLLFCATLALPCALAAADPSATDDTHRDAFQQIDWPMVPEAQRASIVRGRSLVRQTWVIAPSLDPDIAGLGPTYNRPACISCHPRNGRGEPPASPEEPMRSMLVRLSVPGRAPDGGPVPEPVYGDQLNEFGVPGVPGEGEATIEWLTHEVTLGDGTPVELRRPRIAFRRLAHGPLAAGTMTSARVAPPLFGVGLLEAVPESDLLAIAAEQKKSGRGIAGQPNRVWDIARNRAVIGRFGHKANQPTVRQQIAAALAGDMGITSSLFPAANCPPAQTACAAVRDTHPELADDALDAMTRYHHALAVPAARRQDAAQVRHGRRLFARAGCDGCHRPSLRTGRFPDFPALENRLIHPYTDLLLHDMGAGLADGRPDFEAGGRQWRTAPLWGLGLLATVNEHATLLHDGRARSALEAILWHDGEARRSRDAVRRMTRREREALIAFLHSL